MEGVLEQESFDRFDAFDRTLFSSNRQTEIIPPTAGVRSRQILVSLATTAQQCGREFLDELPTAIPLKALASAG